MTLSAACGLLPAYLLVPNKICTAQPALPVQPVQPAQAAQTAQIAVLAQPVQTAQTAQRAQNAQIAQTAQPVQSSTSERSCVIIELPLCQPQIIPNLVIILLMQLHIAMKYIIKTLQFRYVITRFQWRESCKYL